MSSADKSKPLIPYIRQSRAKERTISLDDQRKSIRAWAEGAGVKLASEVVERGVSGSRPWRERELGRAVEACQYGKAGGIIVAFQDRLSRESGLGTAEVWEALGAVEARFVCSSEGLDTATGDHEMLFTIKAAIAREQWKRYRLNWANAKHAAWERGEYVSDPPAGFDRVDGTLVPNEHAETIRRAFELRAATPRASWSEVARVFEEAGVLTRFGKATWSAASLRSLIANEVYTAKHVCTCGCGESVLRLEWEVVPGWLYRKAQAEPAPVDSPTRCRGEGHPLGQGLIRCGTCGSGLHRSSMTRSGPILRCPTRGPGHASILYESAREWIMLEAARAIGPRKKDEGNDAEVVKAEARLADARAALIEAEALIGVPLPAGSKQVLAVEAAENALAGIDRPDGTFRLSSILTPLGVKEHIESLPPPEQRRVLGGIIKRVVLSKERGEPRNRLRIEFQDGSVSPKKPTVYNRDMQVVSG